MAYDAIQVISAPVVNHCLGTTILNMLIQGALSRGWPNAEVMTASTTRGGGPEEGNVPV